MAREKEEVGGGPETEAHRTAKPNSSEEMNFDCSKVTVLGAVYHVNKWIHIITN